MRYDADEARAGGILFEFQNWKVCFLKRGVYSKSKLSTHPIFSEKRKMNNKMYGVIWFNKEDVCTIKQYTLQADCIVIYSRLKRAITLGIHVNLLESSLVLPLISDAIEWFNSSNRYLNYYLCYISKQYFDTEPNISRHVFSKFPLWVTQPAGNTSLHGTLKNLFNSVWTSPPCHSKNN